MTRSFVIFGLTIAPQFSLRHLSGMASVRRNIVTWKDPLVLAVTISLVTHVMIYCAWRLNQRFDWLNHDRLPKWLQKLSTPSPKELSQKKSAQAQREVSLVFVDVDPQLSVPEPPKETKFYGAANSQSASPKVQIDSPLPEVTGKQDKVIKTTENSKSRAQPLQPSPPQSDSVETEEVESKPAEKQVSGDLAFARPRDSNQKAQEESNAEDLVEKKRPRPRTLAEATRNLPGEKMQQTGGGKRLALEPSFDVKITSFGDYDRQFISAVQQCWYELLEGRNTMPGKIVVQFFLNYDGRITDLKVMENTTRDLMLELICKGAIEKPSPYRKWPTQMRREMQSDSREVRFTFYYE